MVGRTVIRTLEAWDTAGTAVEIQPGAFLESYRIVRNRESDLAPSSDVYLMEFDSGGRRYCCPLAQFQPRTLAVDPFAARASLAASGCAAGEQFGAEEKPARDSIAV
jgi:hypothetical protein